MRGWVPLDLFGRRIKSENDRILFMARRPDVGKENDAWTEADLKEIMHNLSLLSEHGVREFYQRAYRECNIINSHTFPPARAVQELVQAWKQLRKWRRH